MAATGCCCECGAVSCCVGRPCDECVHRRCSTAAAVAGLVARTTSDEAVTIARTRTERAVRPPLSAVRAWICRPVPLSASSSAAIPYRLTHRQSLSERPTQPRQPTLRPSNVHKDRFQLHHPPTQYDTISELRSQRLRPATGTLAGHCHRRTSRSSAIHAEHRSMHLTILRGSMVDIRLQRRWLLDSMHRPSNHVQSCNGCCT